MAVSTLLTGAAGRALRTLSPINELGDAAGKIAARQSRMVASHEASRLMESSSWISTGQSSAIVTAARDDLARVFGTVRQPGFSNELEMAAFAVRSGIADIASGNGYLAFANGAPARVGLANAQVAGAIRELEVAAASTARSRVIGGLLLAGAGTAGAVALARGGHG